MGGNVSSVEHKLAGRLRVLHEGDPAEGLRLVAEAGGPVDHVEDAEDDGEDDEAGVVHAHQLHVPRRGAAEGVNAMNPKRI